MNAVEPTGTQDGQEAAESPTAAPLTVAEAMAEIRALRAQLRYLKAAQRAQERPGRDARLLARLEAQSARRRAAAGQSGDEAGGAR